MHMYVCIWYKFHWLIPVPQFSVQMSNSSFSKHHLIFSTGLSHALGELTYMRNIRQWWQNEGRIDSVWLSCQWSQFLLHIILNLTRSNPVGCICIPKRFKLVYSFAFWNKTWMRICQYCGFFFCQMCWHEKYLNFL